MTGASYEELLDPIAVKGPDIRKGAVRRGLGVGNGDIIDIHVGTVKVSTHLEHAPLERGRAVT